MTQLLKTLPLPDSLETRQVLKELIQAHRYLAELKGIAATLPNPEILISTLSLQEAKDSSEIENIFTTQDELYREELFTEHTKNHAAKEVRLYATALKGGFEQIQDDKLITVNRIVEFHQTLMDNDAGIRKLPGTVIKNQATGETIFTPPQDPNDIQSLLTDLERFINNDDYYDTDPLIKMAIAHHQFESIHPFYDGNGRAGRILNTLYLVAKDLLDQPLLYFSGYVVAAKDDYYRLLQNTRDTGEWEPWLLYMLRGVSTTSKTTIAIIGAVQDLMAGFDLRLREKLPKIYSHELSTNLFRNPYTNIAAVRADLGVSRITASKYLAELTSAGFVEKHRMGKYNYFVNRPLTQILERYG